MSCFQGKGRAFCAGGDVTECVRSIHNGNYFFRMPLRYLLSNEDFTLHVSNRLVLPDSTPMLHVSNGLR
jgi:enoyl-CoA hydratase/carnithine racemase